MSSSVSQNGWGVSRKMPRAGPFRRSASSAHTLPPRATSAGWPPPPGTGSRGGAVCSRGPCVRGAAVPMQWRPISWAFVSVSAPSTLRRDPQCSGAGCKPTSCAGSLDPWRTRSVCSRNAPRVLYGCWGRAAQPTLSGLDNPGNQTSGCGCCCRLLACGDHVSPHPWGDGRPHALGRDRVP